MHNSYSIIIFLLVMTGTLDSHAQTEKEIAKVLQKSVKQVIKDPIRVPGVDLQMAGARALELASSVNEAVDASLKESLKSDFWDTASLSSTDLMQVHTSTTPFTTFLNLSNNKDMKGLLSQQFEAMSIADVLANVGTDPGFYLSSDDSSSFLDDTYANLLAKLDNIAKGMFKE